MVRKLIGRTALQGRPIGPGDPIYNQLADHYGAELIFSAVGKFSGIGKVT